MNKPAHPQVPVQLKAGQRTRGMPLRGTSLEVVAYHEAGHAVAVWRLGIGLRKKGVAIAPTEEYSGCCSSKAGICRDVEWDDSDRNRIKAERKVQSLLAGQIAQRRYNPRSDWRWGGSADRRAADDILTRFTYDDNELAAWFKLLRIRTENMFANADVWRAVERLAAALLERKTIPGPEAEEIMFAGFRERLYAEHPEMRQGGKELREHFAALAERDKQAKRAQKLAKQEVI